jgi:hypothetical protein
VGARSRDPRRARRLTAHAARAVSRRELAAGTAVVALASLALGGALLEPPRPSAGALAALGVGAALLLASLRLAPPAPLAPHAPAAATAPGVRRAPLVVCVVAAAATWWASGGGVYSAEVLVLWAVSLATWTWACWPRTAAPGGAGRQLGLAVPSAVAGVVAVGAFLRLHRLDGVPAEPTSDHAEKLLDLRAVAAGEHPVFFPANTGREPAQLYLTHWLADAVGRAPDFWVLKLGTAAIGILAIPLVFALARELAGVRAGLLAASTFALSHWPIGVTRTGLRHGYGVLAAAAALWFAFRYLRRLDRRDAIAGGVAIGAGLHGYTAFRAVPLAVASVFAFAVIAARRRAPERCEARKAGLRAAGDGLVLVGTAALAALPLLRYAVDHPGAFWGRSSARLGESAGGHAVATLAGNLRDAVLAFHWIGDDTLVTLERHAPFLDPVTGAALIAGAATIAYGVLPRRDVVAASVALAGAVLLLPSALSIAFPDENPSAARLGVVAPLVFAVVGIGADRPFSLVAGRMSSLRRRALAAVLTLALAAGLAAAAAANYRSYFRAFDGEYRAFVPNAREVAAAIRTVTDRGIRLDDVYLVGFPHWVDSRNVGFELGAPEWWRTHTVQPGAPVRVPSRGPLALVVHELDSERAAQIRSQFPGAIRLRAHSELPGKSFDVYLVSASTS